MNNQTPFNEIFLTDTQLHILREIAPNSPEDYDSSHVPLIEYGLLDYTPPHKQGLEVIGPKVAISIRGQQYLKYLDEKNHLLRLTEDSHAIAEESLDLAKESIKITKKAFTVDKIILVATLVMLALTIFALISK